jgi:hypothetical protein
LIQSRNLRLEAAIDPCGPSTDRVKGSADGSMGEPTSLALS